MPTARMVVTGGAGRLATAIGQAAPDALLLSHSALDVTDATSIAAALDRARPQVVINAAALADVDFCERHPEDAQRVNGAGPGLLAQACQARGTPLVHISTDYVFSGGPGGPYAENARTDPVSIYGRSKAEGEVRALATGGSVCVARVAWLFGYPGDFLQQMFARHLRGEPLRVFEQEGSPTPVALAARAVVQVAQRLAAGAPTPPILHLAGWPPASRADWFGAALGAAYRKQNLPVPAIEMIPVPALRPRNSALDSNLAAALLGVDFEWRGAAAAEGEALSVDLR